MNKFIKIIFFSLALVLIVKFWSKKTNQNSHEKVLHLALSTQVDNLDPAVATTTYSIELIGKVYEGLLEYHYLKYPAELTPNLAEAMPTISDDGLTYTFVLKKGAYFHDNACFQNGKGREVTAEDFIYSFKRLADPAVRSPFTTLVDIIKGLRTFNKYIQQNKGDYNQSIEGMQALDRYTLQFTLNEKLPLFLHYLAMSCSNVVAKEAVEYYGPNFINHPVGTGPFTLEKFSPQINKLTFIKNKNFRDKFFPTEAVPEFQYMLRSAGKKLPFLDKIIYHTMYEEQPRWLQFREKKIDSIEVVTAYIPQVFENKKLKKELSQEGIILVEEPNPAIGYIGFNCCKKPLDNQKLRQAMSLAFDRETFNKIFTANLAIIPASFIPSCFVGHNERFVNPYARYDLEKAKQYLADVGYPHGQGLPTLALNTSDSSTIKQKARVFCQVHGKNWYKDRYTAMYLPRIVQKKL